MIHGKTRFAPSPTGFIHLGNVRTALFSLLAGDRFLLRVEDTDQERSRAEFVEQLLVDLRWLGLHWDEGPASAEARPDYFQSCREPIYREYFQRLEQQNLAYPCFCTPTELEIERKSQISAGRPPRYGGRCARLTTAEVESRLGQGQRPTLRFRVPPGQIVEFVDRVRGPQKFHTDDIGDFIIRRADGSSAFFFCNAIDDALMGVDLVFRGDDHLSNTPRQILLLRALELRIPQYAHASQVLGEDNAPLSKRNGSRSIAELREEGYLPLALVNLLARLGHHYEFEGLLSLAELRERFDLSHVGKSPSRFDLAHLRHWQELVVHAADEAALRSWLAESIWELVPDAQQALFLELVRSNCVFPKDAEEWARILFTDPLPRSDEAEQSAREAGPAFFAVALDAAQAGVEFAAFMAELKEKSGVKGKQLFMPLRAALTGRFDGPEIAKLFLALDPQRIRRRLQEFA